MSSATGKLRTSEDWPRHTFTTTHRSMPWLTFDGGAEEGKFVFVKDIHPVYMAYDKPHSSFFQDFIKFLDGGRREGEMMKGDLILEVEGSDWSGNPIRQYVAGLRLTDLTRLLVGLDGSCPVKFRCVAAGCLELDLAVLLSVDYPVMSPSYVLQSNVVDNLVRVSPHFTTRPPMDDEIHGKPYHFVGKEEFSEMNRLGRILLCKSYDGFFYGLLKPARLDPA